MRLQYRMLVEIKLFVPGQTHWKMLHQEKVHPAGRLLFVPSVSAALELWPGLDAGGGTPQPS